MHWSLLFELAEAMSSVLRGIIASIAHVSKHNEQFKSSATKMVKCILPQEGSVVDESVPALSAGMSAGK